jgi:Zn-dependent M28 family amino/carboxypeptidase
VDPSAIAARIRRQVTDGVDRALAEKEIWFVATGAKEAGGWGMRALLDAYGDDLRDAMFINIDTVGAGGLSFVSREGGATTYRADRRLVTQAKRTARENDMLVKGREHTGTVSDASVALSRGHRAMSVMAFDINGRLPNWHWHTDTVDAVSEPTVQQAVQFVTALVRDL